MINADIIGGTFNLIGYEAITDFGFALPLYKKSLTSNSWYVAVSTTSYDLNTTISVFEQFRPENPSFFENSQILTATAGDRYITIFLWEGRAIIGDIFLLGNWLETHYHEISKYLSVSLFDIALYSRSTSFSQFAQRAYSSLRRTIGTRNALDWLQLLAARQAGQVDLGVSTAHLWSGLSSGARFDLVNEVAATRTVVLDTNTLALVYSERLLALRTSNEMSLESFRRFATVARIAGKNPIIMSKVELEKEIGQQASGPIFTVSNKDPVELNRPFVFRHKKRILVTVVGIQIDIGPALRNFVTDSLTSLAIGFGIKDAIFYVSFSRQALDFVTSVSFKSGSSRATVRGFSTEIYSSYEKCSLKLRSQIVKLNEKKNARSRQTLQLRRLIDPNSGSADYVLRTDIENDSDSIS